MMHETLSALLDGECTDQELDALLDALDREPEMKAMWGRMQLARDARSGMPVRQLDLCAAVMAGLDRAPDGVRPKVVELASRRRPVSWRTAAGFAAAASVAAVAITLGINFGSVRSGNPALTAANDAGPRQLSAGIHDVAMSNAPTTDAQGNEQMDEDLRYYMIEHSNTLADRGVGGALSYARFAANTADEAFVQPANLASGGTP
ncbi:sigma-E factor negative regulatory protein [Solimonas terrae]|uniref:Sigma-E factor negative regulatory protein n=1 Tax=Solimonas terrae TaxID=1396819 RepID=A0A6M2BQW0_9GAMM|nr:sigma-E factor negative regulatory protein [Solimonas terrae]NGY04439.1 sigma-E factor negative regulatory protein [Solimonas terrae]